MKKILLLIAVIAIYSHTQAQDIIYVNPREVGRPAPPQPRWMPNRVLKNGAIRVDHPEAKIIMGKVTEVTPAFLLYMKNSDSSRTLYATPVANIDSIVLSNGIVQRFTKEYRIPEYKRRDRAEFANLGTNILSGSFGVFTHRIRFLSNDRDDDFTPFVTTGFSYEKIFLKDRLGIEVAPFVALNKKGYGGTLHAKFYAKNYGRFRFGMGPFYKLYVRDKNYRYYNSIDGYNMDVTYQTTMSVVGFGLNFQSNIDRNWVLTFSPSIGGVVGYSKQDKKIPNMSSPVNQTGMGMGELKLSLGYRF